MSTIFHHTARSGNTKCLEILLLNLNGKKVCEENIPSRETLTEVVNRQNEDGKTVCHLAAMNESEVKDESYFYFDSYIYKYIFYVEMIDCGEYDSMIEICGRLYKSKT